MSAPCNGCAHARLGEALKLMRKRGYSVHREVRGCANCTAEKMAAELAKEQGAAGLVFYSSAEAARVAEAFQRRAANEKAMDAGVVPRAALPPIMLWVNHVATDGQDPVTAIIAACAEVGLKAEWSGVPGGAVAVYL